MEKQTEPEGNKSSKTTSKSKEEYPKWGMKEMLAYTEKFFFGSNGNFTSHVQYYQSNTNLKDAYKKKLQSVMKTNKLVSTNEEGKYEYKLPDFLAKALVEKVGSEYLETTMNAEMKKSAEDELSKMVQSENARANEEMQATFYEDYLPYLETSTASDPFEYQMPKICNYNIIKDYCSYSADSEALYVERTMIRALFSLFFDLDEERLRKDFQRFFIECLSTDGAEQVVTGSDYSELKEKLEHPEGYYYTHKLDKKDETQILKKIVAMKKK